MAELTPEEQLSMQGPTYSLVDNGWEPDEGIFKKIYEGQQAELLYRPGKTLRLTYNGKSVKIKSLNDIDTELAKLI